MKTDPLTKKAATRLITVVLFALGSLSAVAQGQIGARPLTHQDIADYGLPETTQVSGGLFTVGVGQPVYLEAQVDIGIAPGDIVSVVWALTSQPGGSTAALAASPLGAGIPIYSPGDRAVYQIADRQLLLPDVAGSYTVTATVTTNGGNFVLTRDITAATYEGYATCAGCHNGGFLPDKVTPWQGTGHATMFTEAIDGLKSSHYNEGCIQCHTLGYDTAATADNGGFDDVATLLGWTFPAELTNGNWAAMDPQLQGLANIQCENCHGPGSEHAGAFGNTAFISKTLSAGDCAQCHAEDPYHTKPQEWENSKHAVATRYPTGEGRESCVGCHSGIGFVERMEGETTLSTDYEAITCAACHDPHDATNPHQIRTLADVTLMDVSKVGGATVITNGGKGKLCMNCHMSRRDAVTYAETYHSHYGPHHGPQADMLAGVNAITYGKAIASSTHLKSTSDACVTCHLQDSGLADTDPAFQQVGGHTFRPSWDGGTPEDGSDDVDLVGACMQCHGPIGSFNFGGGDFDGDGVIEGVQMEVEGLLEELALKLPPLGQATVEVTAAYTPAQLKAAYNYFFVEEDGSKGVHNAKYAVGLLQASIEDLDWPGDSDKDGLPDAYEIANWGSILAQTGQGDADDDTVNNALELAAGTNPKLADSDSDGFNDGAELQAGSDPLNGDDTPGLIVKVYDAAELEFASEVGKTYQVQKVSEITGAWVQDGEDIPGTGDPISHLIQTRVEPHEYYRVVELAP